jgi:RNA polymerase sigma-70 factor, ECF subfamily
MKPGDDDDVAAAFAAALPVERRPVSPIHPALVAAIRRAHHAGATAWPCVLVPTETFASFIATRLPAEHDLAVAVENARHADLYLACACTRGDSRAIAAFDAAFRPQVSAALRRLRGHEIVADEFFQTLRVKLFVVSGSSSGISSYGGLGPLGAWVRVTAVRLALDLNKKHPRGPEPGLASLAQELVDPEADCLKRAHAEHFRSAVRLALQSLPLESRLLLRQNLVDGLTTRDIGRIHGVAHTTVGRWLARARETVSVAARNALSQRLDIDAAELDSILHALGSQMDASIVDALGR